MANNTNPDADILDHVDAEHSKRGSRSNDTVDMLKEMQKTLEEMLKGINNMSASTARDKTDSARYPLSGGKQSINFKSISNSFFDEFEASLVQSFIGSNFRDRLEDSFRGLAEEIGVDVNDLGKVVGKELGKQVTDAIKNTRAGGAISDKVNGLTNKVVDHFKGTYEKGAASYMAKAASQAATTGGVGAAAEGTAALGSSAAGVGAVLAEAIPIILAVTVAVAALMPTLTRLKEMGSALLKSANRDMESFEKNTKASQERILADIETLAKKPFEILAEAAQAVYDTWDANLRTITATQGYTKADLQDLLATYAERIRDEGLSSVISASDMTDNLAKVLNAGLSGDIAEEFSFIATKLNAAIPTEDFFNYADTYASIASQAVQAGMTQTQAIDYANSQLEAFASSLLYSSRQLSGGFSTGLSNAEALFQKSAQIAQTGKSLDTASISSVLTAISSVVGAVAPDLADSLVDAVYNAAVGGNSSELVALRSLAGINASNTEFLQKLTSDPQSVLSQLFTGLSNMQHMSDDNYMEVAEGLSSIFGLSSEAFARVDFALLAEAISNVDDTTSSLDENIQLLASGETTTTAEQLKMQQINKYLIEEGLSYVLDNETARAVQQHMWDEQIARELQETTYSVELQGAAITLLTGITKTLDVIKMFVNPIGYFTKKIANVVETAKETAAQSDQLQQVLEAGKVGAGNTTALYNLMTTNKDLDLVPDIVTLLGGTKTAATVRGVGDGIGRLSSFGGLIGVLADGFQSLAANNIGRSVQPIYDAITQSYTDYDRQSIYKWNTLLSKSTASTLSALTSGSSATSSIVSLATQSAAESATEASKKSIQQKLDRMLDSEYIESFTSAGKTYEDWVASANKFGISSSQFTEALESAGYDEADVQSRFEEYAAQESVRQEQVRRQTEEEFWANMQDYSLQTIQQLLDVNTELDLVNENLLNIMDNHLVYLEELSVENNSWLNTIYSQQTRWLNEWIDYFIHHTAYNDSYSYADVRKIQDDEKSESADAIYALAEALTANTTNLLDPTIQTNALLSQILIVVNSIMQQNNTLKSNISLPDTLAALSTGLTITAS